VVIAYVDDRGEAPLNPPANPAASCGAHPPALRLPRSLPRPPGEHIQRPPSAPELHTHQGRLLRQKNAASCGEGRPRPAASLIGPPALVWARPPAEAASPPTAAAAGRSHADAAGQRNHDPTPSRREGAGEHGTPSGPQRCILHQRPGSASCLAGAASPCPSPLGG